MRVVNSFAELLNADTLRKNPGDWGRGPSSSWGKEAANKAFRRSNNDWARQVQGLTADELEDWESKKPKPVGQGKNPLSGPDNTYNGN